MHLLTCCYCLHYCYIPCQHLTEEIIPKLPTLITAVEYLSTTKVSNWNNYSQQGYLSYCYIYKKSKDKHM